MNDLVGGFRFLVRMRHEPHRQRRFIDAVDGVSVLLRFVRRTRHERRRGWKERVRLMSGASAHQHRATDLLPPPTHMPGTLVLPHAAGEQHDVFASNC